MLNLHHESGARGNEILFSRPQVLRQVPDPDPGIGMRSGALLLFLSIYLLTCDN